MPQISLPDHVQHALEEQQNKEENSTKDYIKEMMEYVKGKMDKGYTREEAMGKWNELMDINEEDITGGEEWQGMK